MTLWRPVKNKKWRPAARLRPPAGYISAVIGPKARPYIGRDLRPKEIPRPDLSEEASRAPEVWIAEGGMRNRIRPASRPRRQRIGKAIPSCVETQYLASPGLLLASAGLARVIGCLILIRFSNQTRNGLEAKTPPAAIFFIPLPTKTYSISPLPATHFFRIKRATVSHYGGTHCPSATLRKRSGIAGPGQEMDNVESRALIQFRLPAGNTP